MYSHIIGMDDELWNIVDDSVTFESSTKNTTR
jgi:hypothetical protein